MAEKIRVIYLDKDGALCEEDQLTAVGINGHQVEVADASWVDLPAGAEIYQLPGRLPFGLDEVSGEMSIIEETTAIAAILPVGYTRALLPAYELEDEQELPLFGYTAVGAVNGQLKVAAIKTDEDIKWNPSSYNISGLPTFIKRMRKQFPENRILEQLALCAQEYHCCTAQNIFYRRWEAGVPVSPVCNCDCIGCISLQPAECCPSPQRRIDFTPSLQEIGELAVPHLNEAAEGIISFGQGCEGEPSLQYKVLAPAITEIRRQTSKGTINMNTNAGNQTAIRALVDAGLDSIRVSLFSAIPANYDWYHRPQGFDFKDVVKSIKYASNNGVAVALNLLLFPGFTNRGDETKALLDLIATAGVHQVQLRNLNLDPEKLEVGQTTEELPTIMAWLGEMEKTFPTLRIGNYSLPHQ